MAEDRKEQPASRSTSQAIPNRDRKREAPVIDVKPADVVELKPEAEKTAEHPAAAPDTGEPVSPAAGVPEAAAAGPAEPADGISAASAGDTPPAVETSATPSPSTEPNSPRHSSGLVAGLLAGVAGAAVALAGGYMLVSAKLNSAQDTTQLVTAATAQAQGETSKAVAAVEQRLRGEIEKQSNAMADLGKQLATAQTQSKKLETELAALREGAAKPATATAPVVDLGPIETGLGDLEKRIATIEAALNAPKSAVHATDPDVKPEPGAAAPSTPAAAVATIVPPALLVEVSSLTQRLKALESRPQVAATDISPLQQRVQEIEKRLAPLVDKVGPLEERIAPLAAAAAQNRDALGSQGKDIAASRARADAAALAVVARSLADAVSTGVPFSGLLKAAQALGAEASAAKTLLASAEQGVPTAAALAAQFEPLAAAILENENKPAPNASFTERLTASAGKLVRVRPADDSNDETSPTLAARIAAALRAGRPGEALALHDKLPQAARDRASAWATALRSRVAADAAAQTILTGALARLAQP